MVLFLRMLRWLGLRVRCKSASLKKIGCNEWEKWYRRECVVKTQRKIEKVYDTKAESIPQTIPPIVYHDKMSGTVILGEDVSSIKQ